MKKYLPTILILLGLFGFYWYRYKRAPDLAFNQIALVDSQGQKTKITELLGDKNVIHFYASWCGPCLHELQTIKNNTAYLKESAINFIFITDDSVEKIQKIKENMPDFIQFFQINNLNEAGIYTLPTTYFLKGSNLKKKQVDIFPWEDKNEIENIFKK